MITVAEAARRCGRTEETVRRWLRAGRLTAHRDGPRLLVDEDEVAAMAAPRTLALPAAWAPAEGEPGPDWLALVQRSRGGRACW